jgi:5-formyltetrahydrofolate cyclo-ligase
MYGPKPNCPIDNSRRAANSITKKVLDLTEYKGANTISIFLSMPGREISTRGIVLQALREGKKVFVPYIHIEKRSKSKVMDMLQLRDENDLNALQPDPWGIPSLAAESVPSRENALGGLGCLQDESEAVKTFSKLDLIFMPAMAFDQSLNRLGHGKGFYDRYLTRYRRISSAAHEECDIPRLGLYHSKLQ